MPRLARMLDRRASEAADEDEDEDITAAAAEVEGGAMAHGSCCVLFCDYVCRWTKYIYFNGVSHNRGCGGRGGGVVVGTNKCTECMYTKKREIQEYKTKREET